MVSYFFLFIIGLAVGSFLNVVSLRYKPEQRIFDLKIVGGLAKRGFGRSRCLNCERELKWYELIPLFSFFIQLGRCRTCGVKLSWQYPIVELLSGLIFVAIPFYLVNPQLLLASGYWLMAIIAIWILIFLSFLLLSVIDLRHFIIPDSINIFLALLGIVLIFINSGSFVDSYLGYYNLLFGEIGNIWLNHFFAAFVGMAFFGLIIAITRGRAMGWGDFKLAGALGLIFGWPDTIIVLFSSFIVGALFSLPFLLLRKRKMKDLVPFGPFMAAGAALIFFLGFNIVDWYFKLFSL